MLEDERLVFIQWAIFDYFSFFILLKNSTCTGLCAYYWGNGSSSVCIPYLHRVQVAIPSITMQLIIKDAWQLKVSLNSQQWTSNWKWWYSSTQESTGEALFNLFTDRYLCVDGYFAIVISHQGLYTVWPNEIRHIIDNDHNNNLKKNLWPR